jgi:iron(III) transport system substrate-binding protein
VILLVDAARLYKGEVDGLFQPIKSKVLDDAIPPIPRKAPPKARPGSAFPPAPA